jgi:ferric iron reductase protein FhuF
MNTAVFSMNLVFTSDHIIRDTVAQPMVEVLASLLQAAFAPMLAYPVVAPIVLFTIVHSQIFHCAAVGSPDHHHIGSKQRAFADVRRESHHEVEHI